LLWVAVLSLSVILQVVQSGLLTSLNFIPSPCSGDLEGSPFSCVTMHGIATFTNNDNERLQTNIISYVDTSGKTVTFETPIGLDISITNVTSTLIFLNSKIMYNGYEEYEPGETCSIARNYGLCRDPNTKPSGENKILCCLDRSPRGMGGHCYRNDYTQKYYLYNGVWTSESSHGRVAITQRGKVSEFILDPPTYVQSIANEGVASIHSEYSESGDAFYALANRIMRDARDPSVPITNRDKFFVVSSETESYLNAAKYWAQHSTCQDPPGKFAVHDIKEHIRYVV